jgi:hypothetical protein
MTLQTAITEFTTANPAATADEVLTHVKAVSVISYRKIGGNEGRQILSLLGALDNLEDNVNNLTVVSVIQGIDTSLGALVRSMLETLKNGQFATDPTQEDGALNRIAAGVLVSNAVLTQFQTDQFFAKSMVNNFPHVNTTLNQVKAIMNPATKQLATHYDGSQDWVISTSNRDVFLFEIDAAEPIDTLKLSLRWKESSEATQWVTHDIGSIQGGTGIFSRTMQKPSGLSKSRLLEFSFTDEYAGQLNSVVVSVG